MDKTIEIVVVAMVALMVAAILLFLVQDRTGSFGEFLEGQQDDAECELLETQYKNSDCQDADLKNKLDNQCDIDIPSCNSQSSGTPS